MRRGERRHSQLCLDQLNQIHKSTHLRRHIPEHHLPFLTDLDTRITVTMIATIRRLNQMLRHGELGPNVAEIDHKTIGCRRLASTDT